MLDIAIIGIALRVPDARTPDEFWKNLLDGSVSVKRFSLERLEAAGVPPDRARARDYVAAKAELEDVDAFDAAFFGYTPKEADISDPQQRIFLTLAQEALDDAGYAGNDSLGIGVFGGVGASTYLIHNLLTNPDLIESLGDYQIAIGNSKDYVAPNVSYRLNLTGPSITVQSACSTSLVAVHEGCRSISSGECAIALAGGVSLSLPKGHGYLYQQGGIMSRDGFCRPFDAAATGTVRGEGGVVFVLKSARLARSNGDRIYAVIRGTAVNNDGASKVGFTAPSAAGQVQVIREALHRAELAPEDIGFVEGHGTGTKIGDAIELAALSKVFGRAPAKAPIIGSVKGNVGHLDAAAGAVGLLKAVLAVGRGIIPPTPHFKGFSAEGAGSLENTGIRVNATSVTWDADARRAGVSSFGIGGSNCHIIVENDPGPEVVSRCARTHHLLVLSAAQPGILADRRAAVLDALASDDAQLSVIASRLARTDRRGWPYRLCVLARDATAAVAALRAAPTAKIQHDSRPELAIYLSPDWSITEADAGVFAEIDTAFAKHLADAVNQLPEAAVSAPEFHALYALAATLAERFGIRKFFGDGRTQGIATALGACHRAEADYEEVEISPDVHKALRHLSERGHIVIVLACEALSGRRTLVESSIMIASSSRRSLEEQVMSLAAELWRRGAISDLSAFTDPHSQSLPIFGKHVLEAGRHWVEPRGQFLAHASHVDTAPTSGHAGENSRLTAAQTGGPPDELVEASLLGLIIGLLGTEDVSLDQDFFEIGGDSLKAIQLRSRIVETFGCEVELSRLIDALTIREQANLIRETQLASRTNTAPELA
jgi:acyl transferase domain-containing protein